MTLYVRIDKNRKIFITTFIRALGLGTDDEIREFFGNDERIEATIERDETKNQGEALMEVFKRLRPGEPVTLESAQQLLDNLFFDPRRYDISRVGRYKYNKKLAIAARLAGCKLAEPVIAPLTGEILAEAGEVVTKAKAKEIERAGVMVAVADVEGKKASFKEAGIEYTIRQIDEYRACGINGIHLYALNKYDDVARIAKEAGLLDLI